MRSSGRVVNMGVSGRETSVLRAVSCVLRAACRTPSLSQLDLSSDRHVLERLSELQRFVQINSGAGCPSCAGLRRWGRAARMISGVEAGLQSLIDDLPERLAGAMRDLLQMSRQAIVNRQRGSHEASQHPEVSIKSSRRQRSVPSARPAPTFRWPLAVGRWPSEAHASANGSVPRLSSSTHRSGSKRSARERVRRRCTL